MPSSRRRRVLRSRTVRALGVLSTRSRARPARSSGESSRSRARKRAAAGEPIAGSTPRSKRREASVASPSRWAPRRTRRGSNHAHSSRIDVVASVTSLSAPPMMPASATTRSRSAIASTSGSSVRGLPSSVVMVSPGRARRTRIAPPWSRARSNAWSGWPISSSTRFVASTTLLTGRWPIAASRRASHGGEGATRTPSTTCAR